MTTDELRSALLEHDEIADLNPPERRLAIRRLAVRSGIADGSTAAALADEIDGFGILSQLMSDDTITDVLVNGPGEVWVDKSGELARTGISFRDEAAVLRFIDRLLAGAGTRLDRSNPIADARLWDGSRMHAVLPPIAPQGPLVSIRRFPRERFALEDLVARGMLSAGEADLLRRFVEERRSIVIGGRTGTGKSTLLDALLHLSSPHERVVTIEELPELQRGSEHRVSLVARAPNVEGKGSVTLDTLVRAALRMRPDRIVVGEVRGPEALSAIEAMATGHQGSMLTVHARSAEAVLDRLVSLALQAPGAPGEASIRRQVEEAIDVVVHLERHAAQRRIAAICDLS